MKVGIIGSGGREHALCDSLKKSKKVEKIYCFPGNAGTKQIAENIEIDLSNFENLKNFTIDKKIDFLIVGPERPLVDGIVDYLEKYNIDANDIAGLIPLTGHTITHFTVRDEMGIKGTQPVIDKYAPLFHVRNNSSPILLITGNRELEMLGRYEENAYLYRMLKVVGHQNVELMELDGYGHGIGYPSMPILLKKINSITKEILK